MENLLLKETSTLIKPKLAFLGLGWIGKNRMEAIAESKIADISLLSDALPGVCEEAGKSLTDAEVVPDLEAILKDKAIEGVVIATPSAFHAEQSIAALNSGKAVFCQKPLGRTAAETEDVVNAARKADKLLGVDLSYRYTAAMQAVYKLVRSGELGDIYAVNLVFHNAYGPDKPWFYDKSRSGGGCVMDLGIHLVDLAMWVLQFPDIEKVTSSLYSKGKPMEHTDQAVEDFATAIINIQGNITLNLSCSWHLQAGKEAIIEATFYGTKGGTAFKNVNGSFYDFIAEQYSGTQTEVLVGPPDPWGGRAGVEWVKKLAQGEHFNEDVKEFIKVAQVLDRIYGR